MSVGTEQGLHKVVDINQFTFTGRGVFDTLLVLSFFMFALDNTNGENDTNNTTK